MPDTDTVAPSLLQKMGGDFGTAVIFSVAALASLVFHTDYFLARDALGVRRYDVPWPFLCVAHQLLYLGVRIAFAVKAADGWKFLDRNQTSKHEVPRWFTFMMVTLVLVTLVTSILFYVAPSLVAFASFPSSPRVLYAGGACSSLGLLLLVAVHFDLGDSWTSLLQTKTDQKLVTTGLYGVVRHPMYVAFLLCAVAQFLLCANWLWGLSQLGFVSMAVGRIPWEEAMLLKHFGRKYEAYKARTWALLPGVY